jgi:hypothetical protein
MITRRGQDDPVSLTKTVAQITRAIPIDGLLRVIEREGEIVSANELRRGAPLLSVAQRQRKRALRGGAGAQRPAEADDERPLLAM